MRQATISGCLGIGFGPAPLVLGDTTTSHHKLVLEQLEFESEMMAYEASAAERRAEKLLKSNERQLPAVLQSESQPGKGGLVTGIVCVVVGIAVVRWTSYAVAQASGQTEAQIVIGAVGAVGAILINYVAALYLRIHTSAAESLTAFHAKLTSTHELFLANLLISRVRRGAATRCSARWPSKS